MQHLPAFNIAYFKSLDGSKVISFHW